MGARKGGSEQTGSRESKEHGRSGILGGSSRDGRFRRPGEGRGEGRRGKNWGGWGWKGRMREDWGSSCKRGSRTWRRRGKVGRAGVAIGGWKERDGRDEVR